MEDAKRRLLARLLDEVGDSKVVGAMERVSRESFVPESSTHLAYDDIPLPIGEGQTISQPYMVAVMVSALELRPTDKVLELGTGSGYQAALLASLGSHVLSMERIQTLADSARECLAALDYSNVEVRLTEGMLGCPDEAPFDAIVVAAGAPRLPRELMDQLSVGGRLVIPVGSRDSQELMKVTRTADGFSVRTLASCRFVPLIGQGAWPDDDVQGRAEL